MIIDWGEHSRALRRGDLSVLPEHLVEALMRLVRIPEVRALASTLSEQPIVVALALAASAADNDRAAVRFARSVLGTADRLVIEAAQRAAGI